MPTTAFRNFRVRTGLSEDADIADTGLAQDSQARSHSRVRRVGSWRGSFWRTCPGGWGRGRAAKPELAAIAANSWPTFEILRIRYARLVNGFAIQVALTG